VEKTNTVGWTKKSNSPLCHSASPPLVSPVASVSSKRFEADDSYFNQSYAGSFSYQILGTLGTNFIGYGLAGLARDFLVFPGFCVWPASLPTVALNKAFHDSHDRPVAGPLNRIYKWSKLKMFYVVCAASFV